MENEPTGEEEIRPYHAPNLGDSDFAGAPSPDAPPERGSGREPRMHLRRKDGLIEVIEIECVCGRKIRLDWLA